MVDIQSVLLAWLPIITAVLTSVFTSIGSNKGIKEAKSICRDGNTKLEKKVESQGYTILLLKEKIETLEKKEVEILDTCRDIKKSLEDKVTVDANISNDIKEICTNTIKAFNDINTVKKQNTVILNSKKE